MGRQAHEACALQGARGSAGAHNATLLLPRGILCAQFFKRHATHVAHACRAEHGVCVLHIIALVILSCCTFKGERRQRREEGQRLARVMSNRDSPACARAQIPAKGGMRAGRGGYCCRSLLLVRAWGSRLG